MLTAGMILQGRYQIIRVLGAGGMSTVYLALDLRLANRQVAVKELMPDPGASPSELVQMRQQFQTEAVILGRLSHPNLPRIYDCFTEAGLDYLVMDYVDGRTLQDILDQTSDFLAESQVLRWAVQICDVLTYLHNQQPPVIFRDLKPANIMVDRSGTIKLIDFGIARLFKPGKTTDTLRLGTHGYAPPEQYASQGQTDARSDIYSLGATLHHLLTRRDPSHYPPFSAAAVPVRSLNPAVSPSVEAAVMKALSYKKEERFQSAAEMKQALLSFISSTHQTTSTYRSGRIKRLALPITIVTMIILASMGGPLAFRGISQLLTVPPLAFPVGTPQTASPVPDHAPSSVPSRVIPATNTVGSDVSPTAIPPRPTISSPTITSTIRPSATPTIRPTVTPTISATPSPALIGRIAFHSDHTGNEDIYIMNADGSNQRRLTNNPASDLYPALSPDGKRIAFVSQRDGNSEIYVIDVNTGQESRLTFEPAEDRLPIWSPDGTKIAFNSSRAGNLDLWVMNADGSNPVRLTSGPERDGHASWSPDGQWLAFNSGFEDSTWEIHILSITSLYRRVLTANSVIDWSPSWSPDGRRILFISKRATQPALYVITPEGGQESKLLGEFGNIWGAVWSPDGRYVAFTSDVSGRDEVYIAKADGSEVRQLTFAGGAYPTWSK